MAMGNDVLADGHSFADGPCVYPPHHQLRCSHPRGLRARPGSDHEVCDLGRDEVWTVLDCRVMMGNVSDDVVEERQCLHARPVRCAEGLPRSSQ